MNEELEKILNDTSKMVEDIKNNEITSKQKIMDAYYYAKEKGNTQINNLILKKENLKSIKANPTKQAEIDSHISDISSKIAILVDQRDILLPKEKDKALKELEEKTSDDIRSTISNGINLSIKKAKKQISNNTKSIKDSKISVSTVSGADIGKQIAHIGRKIAELEAENNNLKDFIEKCNELLNNDLTKNVDSDKAKYVYYFYNLVKENNVDFSKITKEEKDKESLVKIAELLKQADEKLDKDKLHSAMDLIDTLDESDELQRLEELAYSISKKIKEAEEKGVIVPAKSDEKATSGEKDERKIIEKKIAIAELHNDYEALKSAIEELKKLPEYDGKKEAIDDAERILISFKIAKIKELLKKAEEEKSMAILEEASKLINELPASETKTELEKAAVKCANEIKELEICKKDKPTPDDLIKKLDDLIKELNDKEDLTGEIDNINDMIDLYKKLDNSTKCLYNDKVENIINSYNVQKTKKDQIEIKNDENTPAFSVGEIVTEFFGKIVDPIRRSKLYKNHKRKSVENSTELATKYTEIADASIEDAKVLAEDLGDRYLVNSISEIIDKGEDKCKDAIAEVTDYIAEKIDYYTKKATNAQKLIDDQCMVNGPRLFSNINALRKINFKLDKVGSRRYYRIMAHISDTLKRVLPRIEKDETVFENKTQIRTILNQYLEILSTSNDIDSDMDSLKHKLSDLKKAGNITEAVELAYLNQASSIILYRSSNDFVSYEGNYEDIDDAIKYYDGEYKTTGLPYVKK